MSADLLAVISGASLSLAFAYIPGAADWFARLDGTRKRLVMLALLALASLVTFALACLPQVHGASWSQGLIAGLAGGDDRIFPACSSQGAGDLLRAFFLALIANQSVYALTPRNGRIDGLANGDKRNGSKNPPASQPPGNGHAHG
jgi:hypothetical protein